MRSRFGSVSHVCCFRPARRIRSLTIEQPMRLRVPRNVARFVRLAWFCGVTRDLSCYPARTCGELAEPIGISGFGSPVGSAGLLNILTPVKSATYLGSPSKSFHVMVLRTLWRNGRSTTPFDSSASALFLSQRGCGGYFSASSPGTSFPSCFAPHSICRGMPAEGQNRAGVVDPSFGTDEMKCETDPEGGAEEFLRGEVG